MQILQDLATTLANDVKAALGRYTNREFKDACMALCALGAMADGVLQDEEKAKVAACIGKVEALQHFDARELGSLFEGYCNDAKTPWGRAEVLKVIRRLASNHDQADKVMKIGLIVVKSKGSISPEEVAVFVEVAKEMNLNAQDYGLSATTASTQTPGYQPSITPPVAAVTTRKHEKGNPIKEPKAGERVSLKQLAGGTLPAILTVGLGWEYNAGSQAQPLTVSAYLFNDKKQQAGIASSTAARPATLIQHRGNTLNSSRLGDDEEVILEHGAAGGIASVLFVIHGVNRQNVRGLSHAYIRVSDEQAGTQFLRFQFSAQPAVSALIAARIYLHNGEWKMAAIGEVASSTNFDAVQDKLAGFA